jgi:hypothetical protein
MCWPIWVLKAKKFRQSEDKRHERENQTGIFGWHRSLLHHDQEQAPSSG